MLEIPHDGLFATISAFFVTLFGVLTRRQNQKIDNCLDDLNNKVDKDEVRTLINDKLEPINVHIVEIKDDIKEIKQTLSQQINCKPSCKACNK